MNLNTEKIIHQEIHTDKRERYVGKRVLRTSIREFDTGPFTFKRGGPRGKNRVSVNINMKCTCSGCPVQYEGTINKRYAYYRSRHDSWSFEVHTAGEGSPIDYQESGQHVDIIGYSGMLKAEQIIMIAAMNYVHTKKNVAGTIIPTSTIENIINGQESQETK